jgi:hypothetical protein
MGAHRDHRDARESASGSGRGGVAAAPPVRAVDAGLRWWRTRALPPLLPPPRTPERDHHHHDQSVPPSS